MDVCVREQPGRVRELGPVGLDQTAGADALRIDAGLARKHAHHELLFGHLEREDAHPDALTVEVSTAPDVGRDVEAARRVVGHHEVLRDVQVIVAVDQDALTRLLADGFD